MNISPYWGEVISVFCCSSKIESAPDGSQIIRQKKRRAASKSKTALCFTCCDKGSLACYFAFDRYQRERQVISVLS